MTELRSPVQVVLQDAGYQTWLSSVGEETVIVFEDDAVMGFVCVFDDVTSVLRRWREMETSLLTAHAPALQRGGEKTWNVYCASSLRDPFAYSTAWPVRDEIQVGPMPNNQAAE
jgi:hypothetical protein